MKSSALLFFKGKTDFCPAHYVVCPHKDADWLLRAAELLIIFPFQVNHDIFRMMLRAQIKSPARNA